MTNRLANETSPYLLQHAENPVDWYAWGSDALERARREDKPILLSIGYSACHWCHVMERESFEDEPTARVMNDLFVNVKVDREERPDLDSIYMQAVQAMTGHGGWPMTMFLTPSLEPYWGGTYFPPNDRPGMPSFQRVLRAASDAYHQRRDDVNRVATSMREMYDATGLRVRSTGALSPELLARATNGLIAAYDARHGGFGDAPKFPQAMVMEFLLQQSARTGNQMARGVALETFRRMARGGIYDQVGGGFARYSVDAHWLVPHFEKMLYDNALLTRIGVHLWQATGDAEVRRVCEETLAWVAAEMTSPAGGFYSTLDADSEGEEGKFYVWTEPELRELLGADADALIAYWGATADGNFEGANILHVEDGQEAAPLSLPAARARLFEARSRRVRPGRDEKVLASWNGLMLRAVAEAARSFRSDRWRDLALKNGDFLFREMVRDGRVYRTHKDGASRIAGFLEDYASVALGALSLYELTFDRAWLDRARQLSASMVRWFWSEDAGAFFDTPTDGEELLTRPRDVTDNATPSGASLAAELLARLGALAGDAEGTRRARQVLEAVAEPMARYPLAFGHALTAADMLVNGAVEIALPGDPGGGAFRELVGAASSVFVPSAVLAGGMGDQAAGIAILENRPPRDGHATAYVCRNFTCSAPITESESLRRELTTGFAVKAAT
ncbi:MAG TPA: thioredoxin domain-containing protein [Gemmatimonadaceae bacterium]|nr:thioredoxin domain-containing protein [Gemmatimonadaceae bacterium]